MRQLSIYVHIPFCEQKCLYCDFCSFVAGDDIKERYFKHLNSEIEARAMNAEIVSVYFGGGTPSSVDADKIVGVLESIKKAFVLKEDAEITIECNPCSVSKEKLDSYRKAGINRISFGVQSFNDEVLKAIGRLHNGEQAENAVKLAKKCGFENISCDLMIGVPKQTEEILYKDVKKLLDLNIKHISTYMLQLESETPLTKMVGSKEVEVMDEDKQAQLYCEMVELLNKNGFEQYEVSNFAKGKYYSQHNLNYWRRKEYLGFGISAHSFLEDVRFANATLFEDYFSAQLSSFERLTKKEALEEMVMLGLRCFEGVDTEKWKDMAGRDCPEKKIRDFVEKGILILEDGKITLNPKYYSINNQVICSLI